MKKLNVKLAKYVIFNKKQIKKLEAQYNAVYIGDFDINTGIESLFYQPFPNVELGHSHYFTLFVQMFTNKVYITNGEKYKDVVFDAVKSKRTYLISCYRHHYNEKDGVFIDGGRDYTKCTLSSKIYKLKLEDGKFKLI